MSKYNYGASIPIESVPNQEFDQAIRKKVYCMHFNNDECIDMAHEFGFNVVEVYNKSNVIRKNAQ